MTGATFSESRPIDGDVPRFFKALADETRLTIVRTLVVSDLTAGEIGDRLRAPQNAVSYHLKQLRQIGLLRDRPSSRDARDVYYSVDLERLRALYQAAGTSLNPMIPSGRGATSGPHDRRSPIRLLFLCTHNSARSQIAEALARALGGDGLDAFSAGSDVRDVHPLTRRLLTVWNVDVSRHVAKHLSYFEGQSFHHVITVCDRIREICPVFANDPEKVHWSLPDPVEITDPDEQWRAFQSTGDELRVRITSFLQRHGLAIASPIPHDRVQLGS